MRDGKPVTGLETFEQQIMIFKGLDPEVQRQLFMKTLEELPRMPADAATLVAEWRAGDDAALAAKLDSEFEGYEALRERLVEARNRAWVDALDALLDAPGTTLVVVGALH
ncbi:TraB/GumN family protein, partial [Arthrospira platensis SPKY2]